MKFFVCLVLLTLSAFIHGKIFNACQLKSIFVNHFDKNEINNCKYLKNEFIGGFPIKIETE